MPCTAEKEILITHLPPVIMIRIADYSSFSFSFLLLLFMLSRFKPETETFTIITTWHPVYLHELVSFLLFSTLFWQVSTRQQLLLSGIHALCFYIRYRLWRISPTSFLSFSFHLGHRGLSGSSWVKKILIFHSAHSIETLTSISAPSSKPGTGGQNRDVD